MKHVAKYQVIVVGAGHAGVEASLAAARCGSSGAHCERGRRAGGVDGFGCRLFRYPI